jgi:ATP-binding cassette subfamily F protein 3
MLLEIKDGSVSRQGQTVLSHFDFEIRGREKIAVVGRNGAGKTTLLEVIAGRAGLDPNEKNPTAGMRRSRAFSVGMLEQQPDAADERTVREAVEEMILAGKSEEFCYSEARYAREREFDCMFTALGFSAEDKQKKVCDFSGGEQVKIRLVCLLLAGPEVLVLDEPTNHLDLASVEWLERRVRTYPGAVVVVSHDRFFLDRTADVVWEIARGKTVRYPGNYTAYREQKAASLARQRKAWAKQQEEIERLHALIERFRNKPRKAAFARSRKKMLERMQKLQAPAADEAVIRIGEILPARRGGKWMYACEHMKIGYDSAIREVNLRLRRGQKIGIAGANGTGKSTFLRTIAGRIEPLGGKQIIGEHTDAAYFDQQAAALTDETRVLDWFCGRFPALTEKEVRKILAAYLFRAEDLGKKVASLSGGEKARLVLASLLQSRPNLLILDEPTNHMDIPSREMLESLLCNYKGAVLFVSHDRYFLNKVAESLLIFREGEEGAAYYPFGYRHYLEHKEKNAGGADAALVRDAENQRLVEELRAVPKGERGRIRELTTKEAITAWEFEQNRRERLEAEERFRRLIEEREKEKAKMLVIPPTLEEYMNPEETGFCVPAGDTRAEERERRLKEAEDAWTGTLIDWYDIYLETREGREETDADRQPQ